MNSFACINDAVILHYFCKFITEGQTTSPFLIASLFRILIDLIKLKLFQNVFSNFYKNLHLCKHFNFSQCAYMANLNRKLHRLE